MFSSRAKFRLALSDGSEVLARFPTDEEYIAFRKARSSMRVYRGDKWTEKGVGIESSATKLADAVVISGGPVEEDEAVVLAETLTTADDIEITKTIGNRWSITLQVAGGLEVTHVLRTPSVGDVRKRGKQSFRVEGLKGASLFTIDPSPDGPLWDNLVDSTEGYSEGSPVPLCHKEAAISAVIRETEKFRQVTISPE